MARLIDADKLVFREIDEIGGEYEPFYGCSKEQIDNAPTVEAIPKAEVKKFLEEGTKDVSNKVLAIVREDYIHKSVYEARLKADLMAMLEETQWEIAELKSYESADGQDLVMLADIGTLFQQKIDKLKENYDETDKSNK